MTGRLKLPKKVRIVLKHSLPAGTEIHAALPDTLDELEEALARDNPEAKARIDEGLEWWDSRAPD
jgi:hypothetical protein